MAESIPEFIDRINNPQKYPYITNPDGSISTHLMAAEMDEQGNWYVYPTIVMMPTGELYQFNDQYQAMDYNLRTGNFKKFPDKESALSYAEGGYKVGTPLETFNPLKGKSK